MIISLVSDDSASEMSVREDEIISAGVRRAERRIIDTSDSDMSVVEAEDASAGDEDESDDERDEVSLSCANLQISSI